MTVLVDANVLIAALYKYGIVARIVYGHPSVWATTESSRDEVWEYRARWNRGHAPEEHARRVLERLCRTRVRVVPATDYAVRVADAERLVLDVDDAPLVALALGMENDGIWTFNPDDFEPAARAGAVRLLRTADVALVYPPLPLVA